MVDRNVGGYHVPPSEAGTMRAAIVEEREQRAEQERQKQQQETQDSLMRSIRESQTVSTPSYDSSRQQKPAAPKKKQGTKSSDDSRSSVINGIALLGAAVFVYVVWQSPELELHPFVAFLAVWLGLNIVLHIVYYVAVAVFELVKFLFVVAFWGALIFIIGSIIFA